jgi:hypothetical protein
VEVVAAVRELQENAPANDQSASNSTASVSHTDEYAELNAAVPNAAILRVTIRMGQSNRLDSSSYRKIREPSPRK